MSLLSSIFTNWKLTNQDTGEEFEGDFEAQDVTRNVSASWSQEDILNGSKPISQFLNSKADTLTFTGRFYLDPAIFSMTGAAAFPGTGVLPRIPDSILQIPDSKLTLRPAEKLAKLEEWCTKINEKTGRPAIVTFSIGNELKQDSYIESISNIVYDRPFSTGEVRGVTFTMTLKEYTPFSLSDTSVRENPGFSRFHKPKKGDYYELVAAREYNAPLLGDVVRAMNPDKSTLNVGVPVKFPSKEGIRTERVLPRSISLETLATRSSDSAQSTLRREMLEKFSGSKTSFIVPEGI